MIALIAERKAEIATLCRRFNIQRLDLFGSAATGTFDPATSDLDFIVDLGEYEPGVARRLLAFADALEALLGYTVDLVTESSIRNPYFQASVDRQRIALHDARDGKAAA